MLLLCTCKLLIAVLLRYCYILLKYYFPYTELCHLKHTCACNTIYKSHLGKKFRGEARWAVGIVFFVCTVMDFSAAEIYSGVKLHILVRLLSGRSFSHFGELWPRGGSSRSLNTRRMRAPYVRGIWVLLAHLLHCAFDSWKNKLECGPMPNVMAALPNIGGALCSTPKSLVDVHYGVPCSNAAKTRNQFKLAGVPQTTGPSGPKFTILWDIWRRCCCLTSFFSIVDTCLSCEDIARQSCAMVPRWRIFCVLYYQRAACGTFQTCILNSH